MSSVTILHLPDKLDLDNVLRFAKRIDSIRHCNLVRVDLGPSRHFAPFAMLFLAAKFLELKENNPEIKIDVSGFDDHTYPAHMGFFHSMGIEHGNNIGEAKGSARYLPIRSLSRQDLQSGDSRFSELGDLIQKHADEIAELIARDTAHQTELFNAISYGVREMLRNVFEHGNCDRVLYCGQYWPAAGRVEVSILDRGIGIRQSLSTNPNFRFSLDKQAIEMSLLPGVSGKTHLKQHSENWRNSGYGLYMTSRLCRNGGNFAIASGNAAIILSRTLEKQNFATSLKGTAIRMNLDIREIGNVQNRLEEFRKDAVEISKKYLGREPRNPSYMSLLLRRDFRS